IPPTSTVNRQPATVNRQPSTVNRQPSTVNRQPSTVNRQPSTVNRQPSTVNRQPSTVNRQPSTVNPQFDETVGFQLRIALMYVFTRAAPAPIGRVFAVSVAACGRQGADAAPATATSAVNIGPEAIAVVAMATLSSGPAVSGTLVAE